MKKLLNFETLLTTFIEGCQAKMYEYYNDGILPEPKITTTQGKRYVKLIRGNGSQKSVYCFVDKTNGDVLKSAGWAKPAKTARGNIFSDDNGLSCMSRYGAAYLR